MTRRSKLDPYRDQIIEWIRQGKDSRSIRDKLKELGIETSHQNIGIYVKKAMAPTLAKVAEKATYKLESMEQIASEALSKYVALCAKPEAEMTIGERNYFRTVGEWFDRIARIRGMYGPQTQVAVAVQVNERNELEEWAKRILGS